MDKNYLFERNLLALSSKNPDICSLLSEARTTLNLYKFLESRSGEIVPALFDDKGAAHALHSVMDPKREAKRLIDSAESGGFIIIFGLGGGYYAEAALEREDTEMVLTVEYDINGLAELLCNRDYSELFGNPRFRLLVDAGTEELKNYIMNMYRPVLYGGIRVIPLRSRTALLSDTFVLAGKAVESAIERVSADYSVQAHFGKRWFSNIIRNLKPAGAFHSTLPPVQRTAVTAAGPSLIKQLSQLKEKRKELFLIATDTSLPCLLHEGIKPDAVLSIDCQHISYYHFMDGIPEDTLLFLDLASPPLLSSLVKNTFFFSGGHPFTRYISRYYRALPELDTSGGNVTYAAISLADSLGAKEIELYGADFSYPDGISYARGTYIYKYFDKRQYRLSPFEAQSSAFIFRTPLEKKTRDDKSWYYETKSLAFYREKLEVKSAFIEASIVPVRGMGAPIMLRKNDNLKRTLNVFSTGKISMSANDFIMRYREDIIKLPSPDKFTVDYLSSLNVEENALFETLLPAAMAIKRRKLDIKFQELLEETKRYCLNAIDSCLKK